MALHMTPSPSVGERSRPRSRLFVLGPLMTLFFCACFLSSESPLAAAAAKSAQSRQDGLLKLVDDNGLVNVNKKLFREYVRASPRNYHLILLFTAMGPQFNCGICSKIMGLLQPVGQSLKLTYGQAPPDGEEAPEKVFIGVVDYSDNQESFQKYQIDRVPLLFHVPPSSSGQLELRNGQLDPSNSISLQPLANEDDLARVITEQTGVQVQIYRSPLPYFIAGAVLFVVSIVVAILLLCYFQQVLKVVRNRWLWLIASMFIYGVSIAGFIFCIIRGARWNAMQNGEPVFFYPSNDHQFISEGLIISLTSSVAAISVITIARIHPVSGRRVLEAIKFIVALCTFGASVNYLLNCYVSKNRWYQP